MTEQQKIASFSELMAAQGAEFRGFQEGPTGALVLFTDLATRSTLALAESDFCAEALGRRLCESRRAFGIPFLPESLMASAASPSE